jgi:hypothetical protein
VAVGAAADGGGVVSAAEAALVFVTGGALAAVAGAPAAPAALGVALGTASVGIALVGVELGAASAPHAASAHTIEAAKAREAARRIDILMLRSRFIPITRLHPDEIATIDRIEPALSWVNGTWPKQPNLRIKLHNAWDISPMIAAPDAPTLCVPNQAERPHHLGSARSRLCSERAR